MLAVFIALLVSTGQTVGRPETTGSQFLKLIKKEAILRDNFEREIANDLVLAVNSAASKLLLLMIGRVESKRKLNQT